MQCAVVLRVRVRIKQIKKRTSIFEFESFGGHKRNLGALPPNATPWLRSWRQPCEN